MKNINLKNIKVFNAKVVNAKKNNITKNNLIFFNIINPFNNMLKKSLALPPSIKQWVNSVYSYNKNLIKNLPSVDNIVNKIIKGYFSVNPLVNNPDGKKSKLLIRRYNRLSLNKILVGKSEIKHFNDKIFITVFIFNKKKISLLYKLQNLYDSILYNINNIDFIKKNDLNEDLDLEETSIIKNKKIWVFNNKKTKHIKKSQLNHLKILKKSKRKISKRFILNWNNRLLSQFSFSNNKRVLKRKIFKGYYSILNKKLRLSIKNLINRNFYQKYTKNIKIILNGKNMTFFSKKINNSFVFNKIQITYKKSFLKKKYLASLVKARENYRFKSMKINKTNFLFKLNLLRKNALNQFSIISNLPLVIFLNILPLKSLLKINANNLNFASLGKTNKLLKNIDLKKNKMSSFYKDSNTYQLYSYNSYKKYSVHCISKEYYNLIYKYSNNSEILAKDKIFNYKILKKAGKINMYMFITNTNKIKNNKVYNKILNYYVNSINKYKLYNNISSDDLITILPKSLNKLIKSDSTIRNLVVKLPLTIKAINNKSLKKNTLAKVSLLSINKLKALYALTSSYNNINTFFTKKSLKNNNLIKNKLVMQKLYKNNLIFTYKILKKYLKNKYITRLIYSSKYYEVNKTFNRNLKLSKLISLLNNNFTNNNYSSVIANLPPLNIIENKTENLRDYLGSFFYNIKNNNCNLKEQINRNPEISKVYDSSFNLLIVKLEKIDRFFELYKNIISSSLPFNLSTSFYTYVEKNITNRYKSEFIKELLNMELLYVYNLKLISFNNNIFKDWFLSRLKNIISKIYNKKVIFNFISLKYIYLNSDIFTQAIATKLRNSRVNRLNKVLYKAVSAVSNGNIIANANDMRNPIYKYIENHFNKKLYLHKELFSDLNFLLKTTRFKQKKDKVNSFVKIDKSLNVNSNIKSGFNNFKPWYLKIRRLNQLQANTINFIKHKSVFGVRLEASGRLTKRSTASRSIFMLTYKGSLKHNIIMNKTQSAIKIKNNRLSNLQFTRINSKTRNGSFGLKGWINSN